MQYRGTDIAGATYFFTVNLAELFRLRANDTKGEIEVLVGGASSRLQKVCGAETPSIVAHQDSGHPSASALAPFGVPGHWSR